MLYFAILLIVVSFSLNIYLYRCRVVQNKNINYIEKKLQSIIDKETDEKLLVYTDDKQLQNLLIQINLLLEHNQKTVASYHEIERSIRKMLANISHDLKTPLTVILGYIEIMLIEKELSLEKMKDMLSKVNLKTEEVLNLIQRFFELVKLEAGDKHIALSNVDIGEISRRMMLDFYEILTAKEFQVLIEIPEEPIFILGNEDAIQRILNNLISNAIQYGAEGKTIEFKMSTIEDNVFIEVSDRGIGINELHKDHVFERLYTMEDSRNKFYQGSGLGLTITKRLVEQLGGYIFLDSTPYKKTTFTVKFKRVTGGTRFL
ncbi:sensor histidine kinase [Bacillus ndiopicus]|uniref:sensor histidine kinase n=1 Tax=Bacillus ndiopicus TaxID=1347368 RepID=UPI0005AA27E8|nr:ATP-binding protein [Bacillus ndiopicus]